MRTVHSGINETSNKVNTYIVSLGFISTLYVFLQLVISKKYCTGRV